MDITITSYSFVDGMTLHTAFQFEFFDEHVGLGHKKLAEYREDLKHLELIIVDEMSLMKSDMLYKIHRRLCEIFQSEDIFANKSVILVGDLMQLPPVMGKYIFESPRNDNFYSYHQEVPLWQQFEVFTLTHNHRQGEGNHWANVLNEIREGIVTEDTEKLLRSRIVDEDHDELTTCHVFYRNVKVGEHNTKMLNKLASESDELFEIPAVQTVPKGFISKVKAHGTIDGTQYMRILSLRVGARVMLISNIGTTDGLVNGAMGTVLDVIKKSEDFVECIIVSFDTETCGERQRNKYPTISHKYKEVNGTPIFRHDLEYQTGRRQRKHSSRAKLLQFPLRLAWAITAHKMQGQTIKENSKLVIHWDTNMIDGMAYVMLGRSECLKDLFIAGKFDPSKIISSLEAKQESELLKKRAEDRKNRNLFFEEGKIHVGFINIRSLKKHWQDLMKDESFQKCQVVGSCETWLELDEDVTLPGYKTEAVNVGRGQGIATFNKLQANVLFKHASPMLSIIALQFDNWLLVFMYCSQGAPNSDITSMLSELFQHVPGDNIIIVGDFNWDFLGPENSLKIFFKQNGFTQYIENPTHEEGGLLDHVYVKGEQCGGRVAVYQKARYYSDHDALFIKINKY